MSKSRPHGRPQATSVALPATGNNKGPCTHNLRNIPSTKTTAPASISQKQESSILKHIERLRANRVPTSVAAHIPSDIFTRRPSVPQTRKASPTTSKLVSPPASTSASRKERSVSAHIERLSKARKTTPTPVIRRPSPPASRKVSPTMPAPLSFKTSTVVDLAQATQKLEVEELPVQSFGPLVCDNRLEELDIAPVMPLGLRISKQQEAPPCRQVSVDTADLELMPLGLKFNKKSEAPAPAPLDFQKDIDAMFSDMDLTLGLNTSNATAPVMPLALNIKKKTVAIDIEQTTAKLAELTISPVTQLKSCLKKDSSSKASLKKVHWKNHRSDGRLVHEFKVYISDDSDIFARLDKVNILAPAWHPHEPHGEWPNFTRVNLRDYQQFSGQHGEYLEVKPAHQEPVPSREGRGHSACSTPSHVGEICCPDCRSLANMGGINTRSIAQLQTVMCHYCLDLPCEQRHLYQSAIEESGEEDHLGPDESANRADARYYHRHFPDTPEWMYRFLR